MSKLGDIKWKMLQKIYLHVNILDVKKGVFNPNIMDLYETMQYIIDNKCNISRFGDGEFRWILEIPQNSFQAQTPELKDALIRVLNNNNNTLICISDCFGDLFQYKESVQKFWASVMCMERTKLKSVLSSNYLYGNLNITRFYIDYFDISHVPYLILLWKKIWDRKNILIVEGVSTRFGVGNDLFDNTKSIRRILGPAENAFGKYDEILESILEIKDTVDLVLIAMGPTATILSSDLSDYNVWALDIGHLDIEYQWYLMNANSKVAIKYKYVNEATYLDGKMIEEIDDEEEFNKYTDEIILRISADE